MYRVIIFLLRSVLSIIIIAVLYLNMKLYYKPSFEEIKEQTINRDVYEQLQFLKTALENGAAEKMQCIFPEGFVFMNALYGLSWSDLIGGLDEISDIYKEGVNEMNHSLQAIDSPYGKHFFSKDLVLPYGAFYRGWNNFLLGSQLKIQLKEARSSSDIEVFQSTCNEISIALKKSESPYLESYKGKAWPADVMLCIASLSLHDEIFEQVYQSDIKHWIEQVKDRLDTTTGLIPHEVDVPSGKPLENATGSSMSLMLNFLPDIDEEFATNQFKRYNETFKTTRFGLLGILHHPKGVSGKGDIDSGPVILGVGGAASIVGQRAYGKQADWKTYESLRNSIEAFGVGWTINSKKRYVFGQLAMADAFICWSNALEKKASQVKVNSNWRLKFHSISILVVLIFVLFLKGLYKI